MIWCLGTAFAGSIGGSIAGMSVPVAGGGFSGTAEAGAYGVTYAPTASVLGPAPEILVDVGLLGTRLSTGLDSWGAPRVSQGATPVPGLAVSVPLGRFGIGAVFQVPYARGSEDDPEGPQRLFGIRSTVRLLEQELTASVRPVRFLVLGGGLRVGEFVYDATSAIDTGVVLNSSLRPQTPLPVGDPLLEGTQSIASATDTMLSFVVGASLVSERGHRLVVSFRPPWETDAAGRVSYAPSNDLAGAIEGDVRIALAYPAHLALGGRLPLGPVALAPEAEWVGWRRTGRYRADITDLELVASDPLLDGLLGTVGLDQADFVTSQEGELVSDLHWRNVVNLGLAASTELPGSVELRAGVWRSQHAVRTDWINPGNLDFAVWDLRAGAAWQAIPALRLAASADLLLAGTRTVTDSVYTQIDPPSPDLALPASEGRYAATLWRAGLTVVLRLPEIFPGS